MKLSTLLGGLLSLPSLINAFTQPIIWEDLADNDVKRVGDAYYYSASTMHYSPGAPILRSYDLVNWEYIGHSVPTLDFGSNYNLVGGHAYVGGVWASWIGYHPTKNTWFWGGCIGFWSTYIYSAPSATGPWTQLTVLSGKCYYDSGLLIDDDGTMYVSYVSNNVIWVAQLSSDAKSEARSQLVFTPPDDVGYLEGTRMYKRNGIYYILLTKPGLGTYMIKATSPFGSYTLKNLVYNLNSPIGGGPPHQGSLVDTPSGQWYYMGFTDVYPGGRVPILAPVTWGSDDFPAVTLVNGQWGSSYSDPLTSHPTPALTGVDYFSGTSLGPQWEWNHNPDTTKFSVNNGLTLNTVTVTNDLYAARNTLSHRILGPTSTATIRLNYANMKDGDRAGLVLLRDQSAWVGVTRSNGAYAVAYATGITMDSSYNTNSTGSIVTSTSISGGTIYLRLTADIQPSGSHTGKFYYSTNGSTWTSIGTFSMVTYWEFFLGYRFAIFNYATSSLGGYVTVPWFQLDSGSGGSIPTGSSSTSTTTSSTTSRTSSTTTSKVSSTSTSRTSSTSTANGSGCTSAKWGQCAGIGYTGCTICASGSTCTYSNDWYSQCL